MITIKRGLAVASGLLVLTALVTAPVQAAEPPSAPIGSANSSVSWTGNTLLPAGGLFCPTSDDPVCDHFFLDAKTNGYVTVTITPGGPSDDWDLFVYNGSGSNVGSSTKNGSAVEKTCFVVTAGGRWEVDAAPFLVPSLSDYSGTATWSSSPCAA